MMSASQPPASAEPPAPAQPPRHLDATAPADAVAPPADAVAPPAWQPGNDTEQAMAQALLAGNRREFFRLIAAGDLYLPVPPGESDGQPLFTTELLGQTYLPVFTSIDGLARVVGGQAIGYTITDYPELRRKWPNPGWRLAVNPGTPIDAYVDVQAVHAAALGETAVPSGVELLAEASTALADRVAVGDPADGSPPGLIAAIAARDIDQYLRVVLDLDVAMRVAAPVAPEAIIEAHFPWLVTRRQGLPTVEIFTGRLPGEGLVPWVRVPFMAIVLAWPDEEWQLAIDPDTPLAVTVPADLVRVTALWLDDEHTGTDTTGTDNTKDGGPAW